MWFQGVRFRWRGEDSACGMGCMGWVWEEGEAQGEAGQGMAHWGRAQEAVAEAQKGVPAGWRPARVRTAAAAPAIFVLRVTGAPEGGRPGLRVPRFALPYL